MSKQLVLALGAGGAAAAAVVASAASIGTVNSTDLAAGTTVVAPCDSDGIDVSYTTSYNATSEEYDVTTVTLSNVAAACIGQRVKITLSDGTASLDEADVATPVYTGLLDQRTADFVVAAAAADVTDLAVVISG
ncbi:hypothetical protein [Nocardioides sp.]|uniref:hypothetical protein n=1 Tax=Nocardioides sp. TaxID=35761 RepID=UPI002EDBB12B